MNNDIKSVLLTKEQIDSLVEGLAARLTQVYKGKNPILLCILKGSVIFLADLVRKLDFQCELSFITATSYGDCTVPGELKIEGPLPHLYGRDVLIVEDIVDTGRTLSILRKFVEKSGVSSVAICALLDKPSRREAQVEVEYIGCEVPNEFVVGYGLDYNEKYRNLPYVGVLKEELYKL